MPLLAHAEFELKPYRAAYKLYSSGSERGSGERWLIQVDDEHWKAHSSSAASYLFLSDNRLEESIFYYSDSQILPLQYRYERTGTGSDHISLITFDHQANQLQEHGDKDEFKASWKEGLKDGVTYQVAIRKLLSKGETDFTFPIISKSRNKEYRFKVTGKEQLTLPYGDVDTIRLERVRSSKKRETFIWVIPEFDYVIARIKQLYKGSEQFDLQLHQFERLEPAMHPEQLKQLKADARLP